MVPPHVARKVLKFKLHRLTPNYFILKKYHFFFLFGACVNAEAATDLAALDDLGLLKILEAFEATGFDVFSFLAIFVNPKIIHVNIVLIPQFSLAEVTLQIGNVSPQP